MPNLFLNEFVYAQRESFRQITSNRQLMVML